MDRWKPSIILLFLLCFIPQILKSDENTLHEDGYRYHLAVTTIFRNEAPYLREWIEFNRLVGVEHFWLYNNSSTDNCAEVLAPYIEEGIVELFDWGSGKDDWDSFCFGVQPAAYRNAIERACYARTKWLAIIDSDEFIFPVAGKNLYKCLEEFYSDCSGVCVNWQLYGTSNVPKIPRNALMIEVLLYKAPQNYPRNSHYKSIVQPAHVIDCNNPHFCFYRHGSWHVNTNRERVEDHAGQILIDRIRINHYWARDEYFTYKVKMPRYEQWLNNSAVVKVAIAELNQVYDDSIVKYAKALRRRLGMKKKKNSELETVHE